MDLNDKAKALPSLPGVYLMKDSLNSIIYVGKSKSLKNRVSSYFYALKSHSPKVVKLVKNIKDFDYILTDTEFEAFLLECKLIKQIKPHYNSLMKNPLSYTYIKIRKDYSNIEICSEKTEIDTNYYWGPFTSKSTVERAIEGIKECCRIQCSGNYKKSSPCLNYSLGTCIGICFDSSARAKYHSILSDIIKLLSGTDTSILKEMEVKMREAAEKLDFDTAAKYRDYIIAVNSLINKKKAIDFSEVNENIAVLEHLDEHNIKFFLISGTKMLFHEKYNMSSLNISSVKTVLRNNILNFFKDETSITSIEIGRNEIDVSQIIYSYLNSNQNNCKYIVIPKDWIYSRNIVSIDNSLIELLEK